MIPLPLDPKLGAGANPRQQELWVQAARVTRDLQDQIALKAPLASPTFTGTVTIPTPFTLGAVSVTATGTELNLLDGVTATTAELNILDGVTATAAEINILDGVTASAAEINLLDGVTALATGSYTPTASSESNLTSINVASCRYLRVNDLITVSGSLTATTTSVARSYLLLTVPVVAPTAYDVGFVVGSGAAYDASNVTYAPVAISTNSEKALVHWNAVTAGGSVTVYFSFSYTFVAE